MLGIDHDIEHHLPKQPNGDHCYLHIGYTRLKQGEEWGEWTIPCIAHYYDRIVEAFAGDRL